ncbi:MAG: hypothetical protein JNL08_09805 [Planctomycetes bacterium]|nr:hypothetical protein [Planctomycetota bacterium]
MNHSHMLGALAALVAAAGAAAQSVQPVPYHADLVDGHDSTGLPFGLPGFRTQILIDGAAVAPTGAVLTGIRFRSDRPSLPLAGTTVPNVTVSLAETSVAVPGMSTTFAANATTPLVPVFTGTVTVPGNPAGHHGPAPWDIVIAFTQPFVFTTAGGSLLVDIVAANPGGGFPSHWLDAVRAGGSATQYGQPGDNPSGDFLNLIVHTGNDLNPSQLTLGNGIDFSSTLSFSPQPGVIAFGLQPTPFAIDLGFLGGPNQFLHIDPLLFFAHSWTQTFIGWASTFTLAVPNDPTWIDDVIYAQSVLLDPAAGPLGLVLSHAVEVRIGDPVQNLLPMQQLDADDPAAATGTLLDFAFGGSPQYGAVPVQLEGIFF